MKIADALVMVSRSMFAYLKQISPPDTPGIELVDETWFDPVWLFQVCGDYRMMWTVSRYECTRLMKIACGVGDLQVSPAQDMKLQMYVSQMMELYDLGMRRD